MSNTYRYAVTIRDGGNITNRADNVHTILTSTDRIQPRDRVTVEPLADPTDGPVLDVYQNDRGRSFDGFEMTIPEIAARLALLVAGGHAVTVTLDVDAEDES